MYMYVDDSVRRKFFRGERKWSGEGVVDGGVEIQN